MDNNNNPNNEFAIKSINELTDNYYEELSVEELEERLEFVEAYDNCCCCSNDQTGS